MEEATTRSNFVWEAVEQDLKDGRYTQVHTRFPPEPNGYMHIGHCKALITDFLTAEKFGGKCNLRFDDTNPAKEDTEFVEAIKNDIHWLGFDWTGGLYYASDYYDKCYEIAEDWIRRGLAYVDELNKEQMREYRGTLTKPGKNSPWRDRPAEESLDLFRRMRAGEFAEGQYTLRAKIDMASPNIVMRDPTMYRILYKEHWRTGKKCAFTRCMTSRTRLATRWRASATPSARWNTKFIARCMTGWWSTASPCCRRVPARLSSPA